LIFSPLLIVSNITPLRKTIASYLGQVLTPEMAAEIELSVSQVTENPIDLAQFGEQQHGKYTIKAERFEGIQDELHVLHKLHWLETEKHRHGLEMNPDYAEFCRRERMGGLIQFTLRDGDELIGNLRMFLSKSIHTQTRYASEDTLFIRPEHRGSFAAMALMRFAERSLLLLGIREIRANSKLVNHADVLMRRLGYTPVATEFVKFFKD
jgi:GNAT superfamily N-acetyltransferase